MCLRYFRFQGGVQHLQPSESFGGQDCDPGEQIWGLNCCTLIRTNLTSIPRSYLLSASIKEITTSKAAPKCVLYLLLLPKLPLMREKAFPSHSEINSIYASFPRILWGHQSLKRAWTLPLDWQGLNPDFAFVSNYVTMANYLASLILACVCVFFFYKFLYL